MKRNIISFILIIMLVFAAAGCADTATDVSPFVSSENGFITVDEKTKEEMRHPVFTVDEDLEKDKEKLATYLFSQWLELGKQGKLITVSTETQVRCAKLDDYKINQVKPYEKEDDPSSTFRFTVSFSVLPTGEYNDWIAGNGVDGEDGWINNKSLLVEFYKTKNGYKLESLATG